MSEGQIVSLGLGLVVAGVVFDWLSLRARDCRVVLCTSPLAYPLRFFLIWLILAPAAMMGTDLDGALACDMSSSEAWLRFLLKTVVIWFPMGVMYLCFRNLPDTWVIEDLPEERVRCVLEKALAQAELDPERTLTGLSFGPAVTLRIYYWKWGRQCLLEWHPRGAAGHFPLFRQRLLELLSHLERPPRPLATVLYRLLSWSALALGLGMLGYYLV